MPKLTYTYTLTPQTQHALASGAREVKALCDALRKKDSKKAAWRAEVDQLKAKIRNPEDSSRIRFLEELLAYAEGKKQMGEQLAKDLNRDYDLEDAPPNIKTDFNVAKKAAEDFLKDLSYDQQLLANQAQGLFISALQFLSVHLHLSEAIGSISPMTGAVRSMLFSKQKSLLKVDAVEHFYCLTNLDGSQFCIQKVEGTLEILSMEDNKELFFALMKMIQNTALNPEEPSSLKIEVEYPKGTTFEIEPMLSVSTTISMGKSINSLKWKAKVEAHSEHIKIRDGIFEKYAKIEPKPPSKIRMMWNAIKNKEAERYASTAFWFGLLGSVIGLAIGGPLGAGVGAAIGAALGAGIEVLRVIQPIIRAPVVTQSEQANVVSARTKAENVSAPSADLGMTETPSSGSSPQITPQYQGARECRGSEKGEGAVPDAPTQDKKPNL